MKVPSDHMRTLRRRVDFLKSREHKNSFDLAELGALEWAIVNLQPQPAPVHKPYRPLQGNGSQYFGDSWDTPPTQSAPAPKGWKMVPVEPTREMWTAVNKLDDQCAAGNYDGKGCSIEQAWNCLLDAAPTPPAQPAPVQEPVACVIDGDLYFHHEIDWEDLAYQGHGVELLYTTPPAQRPFVGLTDEERLEVAEIDGADEWFWKVCKAIEAKLKEKNT